MEWLKIFDSIEAAQSQVEPGKPRLLLVKGKRICLVRHDGAFFAVQDACTHSGASLSKGTVNYLGEIICPLHNYRFRLSSGQACDSSCSDLVTYPVKCDASGLFVGLW